MQDNYRFQPEPQDEYSRDVRALWPVTNPNIANVYTGKGAKMLVGQIPLDETETLGRLQQAGFIVWEG